MALNFSNFTPANIGANFMAGRKEAQDMETGRLQQQEARMKLDDFQRKQAGLDKFLAAAKQRGKDGDPVDVANDYYEWAVSQRNPELITQAMTLAQAAKQRKDYFASQNPNQLAGAVQPVAPVAGALGSGTFDPNAPAPSAAAPLNALAPSAAAPSVMTPTNALAPTAAAAPAKQNRIDFIRSELQRLSKYPNVSEAKAEATMLLDEYKRLTTPHVVGGSLMSGAGDVIGTVPKEATPTTLEKLIAARKALLPGDPNIQILTNAIRKESEFAPQAVTKVYMPPNEEAYVKEVGGGVGKQDLGKIERSQVIPQDFAKIDETLNVLRNSDINTGIGAELFTVLDKARAQVAADKKAGTRSVNTEYLNSLLGSAVFPQIQALGIGARGMDTPAEREFLRSVMTGTVGLNKDTLIKMTELRRKGLESEANLFNKQVKEGVFAPFEKAARRKVSAIAIPETLQSGADRIPTAGGASKPAAGGGFKYLGKESN